MPDIVTAKVAVNMMKKDIGSSAELTAKTEAALQAQNNLIAATELAEGLAAQLPDNLVTMKKNATADEVVVPTWQEYSDMLQRINNFSSSGDIPYNFLTVNEQKEPEIVTIPTMEDLQKNSFQNQYEFSTGRKLTASARYVSALVDFQATHKYMNRIYVQIVPNDNFNDYFYIKVGLTNGNMYNLLILHAQNKVQTLYGEIEIIKNKIIRENCTPFGNSTTGLNMFGNNIQQLKEDFQAGYGIVYVQVDTVGDLLLQAGTEVNIYYDTIQAGV